MAALLARENFTSSEAGLEGSTGWAHVLSTSCDYAQITVASVITTAG